MPRKISAKKIKDLCNIALDDLKAVDINAFDVEKTSSFASYILLATGTSNRHVKSLAEKVVDDLKDNKVQILGIEGTESQDWILIDAGDVLVNVMNEESREHYDLESIWNRAKR